MPGKNLSRFLGNKKARTGILSGIVVALLVLTTFTGLFLMSEKANAATIISEDFEDITDWTQGGTDGYNNTTQSTYVAHGGTYSVKVDGTGATYMYYDSTDFSNIHATVVGWVYINDTGDVQEFFRIMNSSNPSSISLFYVKSFAASNLTYGIYVHEENSGIAVYGTEKIKPNTWTKLTLILDNGDIHLYNGTTEVINKTAAYTTGETIKYTYVGDVAITNSHVLDFYIDDFSVTDTSDYPSSGPTYPSAPTGATATAYTKFDITLSGYDGNSRFNFSTFNTNDTAGDTAWSNSTSYGIMKVTNDGIQQINLTWSKGTGATNTYIEWNTVSSWSRGAGTLLYNGTGTSATLENVPAGVTRYFELWSWNASGFSETYASCSATAGNASVTNMTIHMEDGGTGTALLPKENITLYGNASGSFAPLGAFDATTGNITLTSTYAGLPLAIGDSLYFEFKSVIGPGAQPNGTYYDKNAETLDCYVYAWS